MGGLSGEISPCPKRMEGPHTFRKWCLPGVSSKTLHYRALQEQANFATLKHRLFLSPNVFPEVSGETLTECKSEGAKPKLPSL